MQTEDGIWIPGYGDMTPEVVAALTNRQVARRYVAEREMRAQARVGRERYHIEDGNGGGVVKMQIHPLSYHYWGQRLGYECWSDAQFCREYLRDNEYARVTSRSKTPRSGWTPASGQPGESAATNYLKRNRKLQIAA